MSEVLRPLIRQRADPHISRQPDGRYLFTASVPEYDRIELRRAGSVAGLAEAEPVVVWRKPECGPHSELIWAPELHHHQHQGQDWWTIYFAAAPSREILNGLFQHRMYALRCAAEDPLQGPWEFVGPVQSGLDSFCLDASSFSLRGQLYYLWAQKDPAIAGNSNLYIAPMASPWQLAGPAVRLSQPEYDWECRGFSVNEGPSLLQHGGRLFLSYSASATDANYAMGLLWMDEADDPLQPQSWHKAAQPVLVSSLECSVYGPGHNSFTTAEDGQTVLLVYHARTYTEIDGDPLWNPDRHTFVKPLRWDAQGMPLFGDAGLSD